MIRLGGAGEPGAAECLHRDGRSVNSLLFSESEVVDISRGRVAFSSFGLCVLRVLLRCGRWHWLGSAVVSRMCDRVRCRAVLVAVALISVVDLKETGDTCVAWKRSVLGLASQSLRESQKNLRDC